jgi:hypothetical protein
MEGIDLLIVNAKPYRKPSLIVKILDILLTAIYLVAYGFGIYFLISSLVNLLS